MTKWFPEYIPVKNPAENKKGWVFPYSGGEWPEKEDWYWVWASKEKGGAPSRISPTKRAWWDKKKGRFLAVEGDVYAWRKAVVYPSKKKARQLNSSPP